MCRSLPLVQSIASAPIASVVRPVLPTAFIHAQVRSELRGFVIFLCILHLRGFTGCQQRRSQSRLVLVVNDDGVLAV